MKIGDIFNAAVKNLPKKTCAHIPPFSVKIWDIFGDSFVQGQVPENGDFWSPLTWSAWDMWYGQDFCCNHYHNFHFKFELLHLARFAVIHRVQVCFCFPSTGPASRWSSRHSVLRSFWLVSRQKRWQEILISGYLSLRNHDNIGLRLFSAKIKEIPPIFNQWLISITAHGEGLNASSSYPKNAHLELSFSITLPTQNSWNFPSYLLVLNVESHQSVISFLF